MSAPIFFYIIQIREYLKKLETEYVDVTENPDDKEWVKKYRNETAWNVGRGDIEAELYGQIHSLEWVLRS